MSSVAVSSLLWKPEQMPWIFPGIVSRKSKIPWITEKRTKLKWNSKRKFPTIIENSGIHPECVLGKGRKISPFYSLIEISQKFKRNSWASGKRSNFHLHDQFHCKLHMKRIDRGLVLYREKKHGCSLLVKPSVVSRLFPCKILFCLRKYSIRKIKLIVTNLKLNYWKFTQTWYLWNGNRLWFRLLGWRYISIIAT